MDGSAPRFPTFSAVTFSRRGLAMNRLVDYITIKENGRCPWMCRNWSFGASFSRRRRRPSVGGNIVVVANLPPPLSHQSPPAANPTLFPK